MSRQIQDADFKTGAELVAAGGTISELTNDDKIYVTASSIFKTLKQAIIDGDIGGGGGGTIPMVSMAASTQSVPNNATTKYALQNTNFDTGGMADPTTNFRINIIVTGTYWIHGAVYWAANNNGVRQVAIYQNGIGGTIIAFNDIAGGIGNTVQECNNLVQLTAGDYLELYLVQTSGGALNALSATYLTGITAFLISGGGGGGVTNWANYTPTITGFGTVSGVDIKWRKVGNSIEVNGVFNTGTQQALVPTITLPGGFSVSSTMQAANSLFNLGNFVFAEPSLTQFNITGGDAGIFSNSAASVTSTLTMIWRSQSNIFVQDNVNTFVGTGWLCSFNFSFIHA